MYRSYCNQGPNENLIRFTPPGFCHSINVQFPRQRLPVCESCKKRSKTREQCRARDCHTALPWCDTFVCISLDNSCTGSDGKLLDEPFVVKVVAPIAFNLKGDVNLLTPACAACREKNYTRAHCRQKKRHRQLPWNTIHIICSLSSATIRKRGDPVSPPPCSKRSKNITGASDYVESTMDSFNAKRKKSSAVSSAIEEDSITELVQPEKEVLYPKTNKKQKGANVNHIKESGVDYIEGDNLEGEGDNLEELKAIEAAKLDSIPRSRTFLVTISTKLHRVEWLDIDPAISTDLHRTNELDFGNHVSENMDFCNTSIIGQTIGPRSVMGSPGAGVTTVGTTNVIQNINARSLGAVDVMHSQHNSAAQESMNTITTVDSNDYTRITSSAADGLGFSANDGGLTSRRSNISSQFEGGRMPQFGVYEMMSHDPFHQMEVNRRPNQTQVESIGRRVPFESLQGSERLSSSAIDMSRAGFSSLQEMIQYDQTMRYSRDLIHAQLSLDDSRMIDANIPIVTRAGQSDYCSFARTPTEGEARSRGYGMPAQSGRTANRFNLMATSGAISGLGGLDRFEMVGDPPGQASINMGNGEGREQIHLTRNEPSRENTNTTWSRDKEGFDNSQEN
jgi:hypothetical protein